MKAKTAPYNQATLSIAPAQVTVAIEGWNATDLQSGEIFERTLRSIIAQIYPIRKCELIIIMDASLDPNGYVWIQNLLPEAKIVRLTNATYYRSKNAAIESAKG